MKTGASEKPNGPIRSRGAQSRMKTNTSRVDRDDEAQARRIRLHLRKVVARLHDSAHCGDRPVQAESGKDQ